MLYLDFLYNDRMHFFAQQNSVQLIIEELAQGKPAFSTTSVSGKPAWNGNATVDGNFNTNPYCNSCLFTTTINRNKTAFLTIDLLDNYTISMVQIYQAQCYDGTNCAATLNTDQSSCNCKYLAIFFWLCIGIFMLILDYPSSLSVNLCELS